jgi:hypothetical protein
MTSPETLNTKVGFSKLNFPLVTHMVHSKARFESYEILKSGQGNKHFLDRLDIPMNDLEGHGMALFLFFSSAASQAFMFSPILDMFSLSALSQVTPALSDFLAGFQRPNRDMSSLEPGHVWPISLI